MATRGITCPCYSAESTIRRLAVRSIVAGRRNVETGCFRSKSGKTGMKQKNDSDGTHKVKVFHRNINLIP